MARVSDGTILDALVFFRGGGAPTAVEETDKGPTIRMDLTHSHFEIVIEVDGQSFSRSDAWGWRTLSPIIRRMFDQGYHARCCLTCSHYSPSHMTDEWSFGENGYCLALGEPDMRNLTHMLYVCQTWAEREDGWYGQKLMRF